MKKYVVLLFFLLCVATSCNKSTNEKEQLITNFKSEMKKLNDSSSFYFDKGIKLLEEGVSPSKIANEISSKLKEYEVKIDKKSRSLSVIASKLKLSDTAYNAIINELKELFKENQEKYAYLTKNGVKLN